jgi:16S rRNA (uracil1498-N3)-methyltransferase
MHRFFVAKEQIPSITGSDVHHIKDVLRMKVGEQLELLDGTGKIYEAKISELKKDKIICEILSTHIEVSEPKAKVTLAQCLPKAKKMELIIQKCTELGIDQIIPILSERTIARREKTDRWRTIAREAAEQSGRSIIPEISPLIKFEDLLKIKDRFDLALIPWELERKTTLKSALKGLARGGRLLILIGPEGGFSTKEVELAKSAGFTPLSLGIRILRTETAGMAILSMINYEYS